MNHTLENANQALQTLISEVKTTYYPVFHLTPPAGWMNDPNGLIYFAGQYHAFYQHYPYNENWGPMHWGHATSRDLVYWQHQPIALAPDADYDKDGCFSGCAVDNDGVLTLIYTGHVWLNEAGDDSAVREVQCLATSTDGINFTKHGPVLTPPEGIMHFRDPKVWRQDGYWYLVVGARTPDDCGQVLLYFSHDLHHWQPQGVLAQSQPGLSYMWECPDFFPLGDKYVLIFSPQGMKAQDYQYRNLFQSGGLVGQWAPGQPFIIEREFQELDAGHDFYAPQSFRAADGRRIIFGWMDMWGSAMPGKRDKWAGSLTLPRELTLDSKLNMQMSPARELQRLRQQHTSIAEQTLNSERKPLKLRALHDEIQLTLDLSASDAERFGLEIAATSDGLQGTLLYVDQQSQRLVLDRSRSGLGVTGYRSIALPAADPLNLRIFIDRSSIEVFVNQGEACLTSRIYPSSTERTINLFAENGSARFGKLDHWQLESIFLK